MSGWTGWTVGGLLAAAACGCASVDGGVRNDGSSRMPTAAEAGRVILRSGRQTVVVGEPQKAAARAAAAAREAGGTVYASACQGKDSATLDLRVPAAELEAVMDRIAQLGDETSRSLRADDVTGQVVDLEAALKNKTALRDRLRALLAQAKDVKDILSVEEQLTRLQTEIDAMESRLKSIRSRVALSELDVTLERRRILGPVGYVLQGAWWVVEKLFVIR